MINIVLDERDKELEKRGLRFIRYADEAVICVRRKNAAERAMESATRFIERCLKLKVILEKSAVDFRKMI
jgi:RNA-directed DNA polymerase